MLFLSDSSWFLKARILGAQGDKKSAIPFAKEALSLAQKAGRKGYAGFISGTIASWEK